MAITRLCPLLKYRKLFLDSKSLVCYQLFTKQKSSKSNAITTTSSKTELDTNVKPLGEKVKETTKTASYLGIILIGVGVTGTLFYAVFNELFSSKSPNNVYTKAMKKCISDPRIEDKLGLPITAYGEETRRGRRQHVQHLIYEKDGKKCLRMKFYLQGSRHKGTVQLEMIEVSITVKVKFIYSLIFLFYLQIVLFSFHFPKCLILFSRMTQENTNTDFYSLKWMICFRQR